jgi:hypothetical protein
MKRLREGYTFPQGKIHMWSRYEEGEGLVIIPADEDWQFMFRFMIE